MHSIAVKGNKKNNEDEIWSLDKIKMGLSCSGIGLWSYNARSKIFNVCEEVEKITGGAIKGALTLKNMVRIISFPHIRQSYNAFQSCVSNQCSLQLEIPISNKKWIFLKGSYNPDLFQFQGMLSDISVRKISDLHVSTLIAKLSHELRSPLTTIRLYTQQSIKIAQLVDSEISPLLEMADRQISRLNALVDDFLLASTRGENTLILNKTRFSIDEVLINTIDEYFSGDSRKRIVLHAANKLAVFADRGKIIQVLINYIGNALKYSPETSRIIITSRKKKGYLVITVQDFGIGISVEEQESIFQKYYRCKNVSSANGYGIGLFVVREIIEAHNGSFGVKSTIGQGSTFHFSIPVAN